MFTPLFLLAEELQIDNGIEVSICLWTELTYGVAGKFCKNVAASGSALAFIDNARLTLLCISKRSINVGEGDLYCADAAEPSVSLLIVVEVTVLGKAPV